MGSESKESFRDSIQCANCGGTGHVYRHCNHPITSYGIVLYKTLYDPEHKKWKNHYLMVQRKDSLSYVEFMRGKYTLDQKSYLLRLFTNMTDAEREQIVNCEFEHLWRLLWQTKDGKTHMREFSDSKIKFEMLKKGYILKNDQHDLLHFFDIDYILKHTENKLTEPEWGFPKGRRNVNELDYCCALREFKEETGIHTKYITLLANSKPFEEVFSGTNKVRYKHIYYLASCFRKDIVGRVISKEIKDVQWFSYEEAQSRILEHNVERKELFRRIDAHISRQFIHKHVCLL